MLGPILKASPQIRVLGSPNWHRDWETSTKRKNCKKKLNQRERKQSKYAKILANIRWKLDDGKCPQTFFKMIET